MLHFFQIEQTVQESAAQCGVNRKSTGLQGRSDALWARIAQNVKKPPLTVNVIDFEFFGFNVAIWVPWSPLGPKKS